ncbi:MAG: type II secretion system F family protein [Fuerstiella sp.]
MPVTLEDIRNLSHEVRALVQAGLPLESHLAEAGTGHGQRLQQLTQSISDRLAQGESLEDTVRDSRIGAPRMLTAAVAAGVRTGRLNETIEMLGDMADDLVELRRRILQSITYPLTVVAMALLLFFVFIRAFLSRVEVLLDDHTLHGSIVLRQLIELDSQFWWWPLVIPGAAGICVAVWVFSGRAASMAFQGPERLLFLLPGVGGMIRDLQFYNLSRMLSLMIDRGIPLTDALQLAGACCGNGQLDEACQRTAAAIQRGDVPAANHRDNWRPGALPPLLLAGLRQAGQHEQQFRERLSSVAGYYQRRLHVSVLWLRNVVPVAMFVILGGGSVALYAFSVFWPVTEIYRLIAPN